MFMKTQLKTRLLKRLAILALAFILQTVYVNAQQNALGVRLGTDPGITYKRYFANNGGVELMLHTGYRALLFTGLYEWHLPFNGAPGLYGYLGAGAHFGAYNRVLIYRRYRDGSVRGAYVYDTPSAGVDGIMGLEYRIPSAPVNLGIDIKPSIDFYRGGAYGLLDAAFSVRFRF
jgi:hypothetical protein